MRPDNTSFPVQKGFQYLCRAFPKACLSVDVSVAGEASFSQLGNLVRTPFQLGSYLFRRLGFQVSQARHRSRSHAANGWTAGFAASVTCLMVGYIEFALRYILVSCGR